MSGNKTLWYKVAALILVLALIVPMLAACGDDDDDDKTTTVPTTTATTTPTPASTGPIKIGVVSPWTGPSGIAGLLTDMGIAAVKRYVEEMGGILGGRPVQFVKEDTTGQVAGAVAAFTKLALDDNISVIVGSTLPAELAAMTEKAQELKVPFINTGDTPRDLTDYTYTAFGGSPSARNDFVSEFIIKVLKPKTMVALMLDDAESRGTAEGMINAVVDALGTKMVDTIYVAQGTTDLTPILTRVKSKGADVILTYLTNTSLYPTMFNQMETLGGWGDSKVVQAIGGVGDDLLKLKGAQGSYNYLPWTAGLPFPGSQTFERLYQEVHGKPPVPYNMYSYMPLMNAVNLIDQAGTTDRDELQKYLRSGNLSWDGLTGPYNIKANGENDMTGIMTIIEDEKWVPILDWQTP